MEPNSTEEYDINWLLADSHCLQTIFLLTHSGTLACIAVFAKRIHDRAELDHPVFVVIFQEVLVMLAFEACGLVLIIMLMFEHMNKVILIMYSTLPFAFLQFHQGTWLVVTYLR